jgi:hypothetical protein
MAGPCLGAQGVYQRALESFDRFGWRGNVGVQQDAKYSFAFCKVVHEDNVGFLV